MSEELAGDMSRLIAEIRQYMTEEVEDLEAACAPTVQNICTNLRATVRQQLEGELRKESEARLQESLSKLREQFMQKIERAGVELEIERRRLREGAGNGGHARESAILEELRVKEAELDAMTVELTAMVENPEVEISKMMRHNSNLTELRAYVRGLKFQLQDPQDVPSAEAAS